MRRALEAYQKTIPISPDPECFTKKDFSRRRDVGE
jgi:hypothetical protein